MALRVLAKILCVVKIFLSDGNCKLATILWAQYCGRIFKGVLYFFYLLRIALLVLRCCQLISYCCTEAIVLVLWQWVADENAAVSGENRTTS